MKRVLIRSGIILMVLFIWTCGDNMNSGNEILSLTASDSLVAGGGSVLLVCTATDEDGDNLGYVWKCASGTLTPDGNEATWVAPDTAGIYFISCTVVDGYGASDAATIAIEVIKGNAEPVITNLTTDYTTVSPDGTVLLTCTAEDDDGDILTYSWECTNGSLAPNGNTATWTAPGDSGTYSISCSVNDGYGASDTATIAIEVVFDISVSGTVLNAVDRSPVANVLVTISGQTGTTNANGNYTIPNVGTGNHDAAGSSDGFCPFSAPFTIPDDHDGESFTYNFSMSPVLEAGQTRMVLNWGPTPPDLDSHLLTPDIEGSTHHIYYGNTGSYTAAPYAKLDTDDINGYGPETITISQGFAGTYTYYIKNFNGASDGLKNSSAVAQVYSGESCTATIIEVPTDTDGLYWYVCDIDGATGDITVVNQIQNSAP